MQIRAEQFSEIWSAVVLDNAMINDHIIVSNWMRSICDDFLLGKNQKTTSLEDLKNFYQNTICSDSNNSFINLNIEGYHCIQGFFLLVNLRADKLLVQDDDVAKANSGQESTSINSTWVTSKTLDPDTIKICAKVAPNEMEGISILWKIAIDCQEKKVGEAVTKMLLQLHTQVDFGLEEKITQFEDQFVQSCMQIIAEQKAAIEVRSA